MSCCYKSDITKITNLTLAVIKKKAAKTVQVSHKAAELLVTVVGYAKLKKVQNVPHVLWAGAQQDTWMWDIQVSSHIQAQETQEQQSCSKSWMKKINEL